MFGKKAKELELLLTQRNHENDLMRKRISELEAEVSKLQDQEHSVLKAITEADKTAARIIDEANANAESINADAAAAHDKLIAEAKQRVCDAAVQANNILSQADAEANSIRTAADEYASATRAEADSYSENIRTDANIYVERTIMAAQLEVKKRKDVLSELNTLLRSTADYVSDQVLTFTDAIETSANKADESSADLCKEIEKCNCTCSECAEPCHEQIQQEAAPIHPHESEACDDNEHVFSELEEAAVEEAVNEAADGSVKAASDAVEAAVQGAVEAEATAADALGELSDRAESAAEASFGEVGGNAQELIGDEPKDPAELMRRIYNIEGRVIPLDGIDDELSDRSPDGGLAFKDELGEGTPFDANAGALPNESELDSILKDVLGN